MKESLTLEGDLFLFDDELHFNGTDQTGFVYGGFPLDMILRMKIRQFDQRPDKKQKVKISITLEES